MAVRKVPDFRSAKFILTRYARAAVRAAANELRKGEKAALTRVRASRSAAFSPAAAGGPPARRTGGLAGNVFVTKKNLNARNPKATLYVKGRYAMLHEKGGEIRAKNAKALPVPISTAARKMLAEGPLRRDPALVTIYRPGRPPIIVTRTRRRTNLMFVLKRAVTIPARPYFRGGIRATHAAAVAKFKEQMLKGLASANKATRGRA